MGRPYYQLAASARRTSGSDCGSWPTARQSDGEKNVRTTEGSLREIERKGSPQDLNQAAVLAGWPTPQAQEQNETPEKKLARGANAGLNLRNAAEMASWPTPRTPTGGPESGQRKKELGRTESGGGDLQAVVLTAWATPTGSDQFGTREKDGKRSVGLNTEASWATPQARDGKGSRTGDELYTHNAVMLTPGLTSSGSPAQTEKRGQLNPAFSLWLMGYPPEWDACAPRVTRSCRRLLRNS